MSETHPPQGEQAPAAPAAPVADRLPEVQALFERLLGALEVPAKLELKDAEDGGISVALFVEGEVAGFVAAKRSNVVDALQFLANKAVNRPGTPRRWISLAVGGHAPPRPPPSQRPVAPPVAAPVPAKQAHAAQRQARPVAPLAAAAADETTLSPEPDAALAQAAKELAEKCARVGRYYAIWPMALEDRARVLRAAREVPGLSVRVEGEGRNRRVVFTPDKPTPMPTKGGLPDYGDEEDL